MFDHLKKLKNTMTINIAFLQRATVIKACQTVLNKLWKYYSKTKNLNEIIYNFVDILNLTQKLNFKKYKMRTMIIMKRIRLVTRSNIKKNSKLFPTLL